MELQARPRLDKNTPEPPKTPKQQKVFYVWYDAPIGYISITAGYTPRWREWWQAPDDVELVQFMVRCLLCVFRCLCLSVCVHTTPKRHQPTHIKLINTHKNKQHKNKTNKQTGQGQRAVPHRHLPCHAARQRPALDDDEEHQRDRVPELRGRQVQQEPRHGRVWQRRTRHGHPARGAVVLGVCV